MKCLADGDRKAFSILYDRYFDRFVRFSLHRVDDLTIAQDIVQNVWIKIMEQPERFNPQQKFSTWAFTLVGNASKNYMRDEQNRNKLLNAHHKTHVSESHKPSLSHDFHLLRKEIEHCKEELSDKQRAIYQLRFEQELPIRDIASILEIPEGSVKSGIFYILKKITTHLKHIGYEQ
ncbi:MAG: sigma-70 family RNA polymerase sigma factor [Chitinophagaceae bacterium]|nr:sigma-70 family RNA polymerase sigma factor [Chitinophagaceae bacterium]